MKHLEDVVEKLKGELENSDQVCQSVLRVAFFCPVNLLVRDSMGPCFFTHGSHVQGSCSLLSKGFVLFGLSGKVSSLSGLCGSAALPSSSSAYRLENETLQQALAFATVPSS